MSKTFENNEVIVQLTAPKRKSFMIEDILGCTHDHYSKPLTPKPVSTFENDLPKQSTRVSSKHAAVLSCIFSHDPYPSSESITKLANDLSLTEVQIRCWFNNKRHRIKTKKSKLSKLNAIASGLSPQQLVPKHPSLRYHHGYTSTAPYPRPSSLTVDSHHRYRVYQLPICPSNSQLYPGDRLAYPSNRMPRLAPTTRKFVHHFVPCLPQQPLNTMSVGVYSRQVHYDKLRIQ
ncbi:Homeobox protein koza [Exaiptasia diaphana]|nr:Homeobox protein koza [Exaiptasia diaphana]